jgi:hypothetical protein
LTKSSTDGVTVTARLYDYENKPVSLDEYNITWSFKEGTANDDMEVIPFTENG